MSKKNKFKKVMKLSSLLVMLFVGMLALTACGGEEESTTTEVSKDAERVQEATLDVWVSSGKNTDWLQYACDAYNEEFGTNITLNFTDVPSTDIIAKTTPMLAAGEELPEISFIQDVDAYQIISQYPDAYVSLTDYGIAEEIEEQTSPGKYQTVTNSTGGELMCFPNDLAPALVFYRQDLFEQCGINYEEDIQTMQDLFEAGELIYEETGVQMLAMQDPYDIPMYEILLEMQGSFWVDAEGNLNLDTEEAVYAAESMKVVMNSPAVSKHVSPDQAEPNRMSSSIVIAGSWWGGTNKDNNPDQAGMWSVAPLPTYDPDGDGVSYSAINGGSSYYVGANSDEAQAAMQFMYWTFTNPEVMTAAIGFGITPANVNALASEEAAAINEYYEVSIIQIAEAEAARYPDVYFNAPLTEIRDPFAVEMEKYVKGEYETAEEAIDVAIENINASVTW